MTAESYITRGEVTDSLNRMEDRLASQNAQILVALGELKLSVTNQFEIRDRITQSQQKSLTDHEAALAVLKDRSQSDILARWVAGVAALIAAIAAAMAKLG